jgi:CHAT domain-containing protein
MPDSLTKWGKNYGEIAFCFSEKAKARSLVEMLARARTEKVAHLLPKSLAEKEARLTAYLGNLESQIDQAFEKGKEAQQVLARNIKETRAELEALITQIKKDYPDYAALRYPEAVTVAKLPLQDNERVLEYQVTEDATYLFVVQKGKVDKFLKIPISRKELEEKIRHFRAVFEKPDNLDRFNPHEAQELYTLLVAPGLEGLDRNQHLILVPDGPLHLLPFEALVVEATNATKTIDPQTGIPSYHGITYLADQWQVSYYQSATVLALNRTAEKKKPSWQKPLFALADPIFSENDPRLQRKPEIAIPRLASAELQDRGVIFPVRSAAEEAGYSFKRLSETREEVLAIAKLYGVRENAPDIKLGLIANEKEVKQMDLTPYQNVIFATHGILGTEVPYLQQPALVLSQVDKGEEDGFLTMEEVLGTRLNADLVTLSACQTGLGKQIKGEGVVGLSRAFMYAGTKSVLVSLWSVSSNSTEALMKAFYSYMKAGKSKAEALRLAKRDIRQGKFELSVGRGIAVTERKIQVDGSHPFFWAPFVLIGEWK